MRSESQMPVVQAMVLRATRKGISRADRRATSLVIFLAQYKQGVKRMMVLVVLFSNF